MHCRNCLEHKNIIVNLVGSVCPVCRLVYEVSEQQAKTPGNSLQQREFWIFVGAIAIGIGIGMVLEDMLAS